MDSTSVLKSKKFDTLIEVCSFFFRFKGYRKCLVDMKHRVCIISKYSTTVCLYCGLSDV